MRGGATYSYTGPAGVAAGGVPYDSRTSTDVHCGWTHRTPPQLGGKRKSRKQQKQQKQKKQAGGACGCGRQIGGGGGNGGYSFDFGNNALGKVYAALPVGACKPFANQLGGSLGSSDQQLREIVSYPSGYGFGSAGVMSTNSAHYLDPSHYNRACMGGARSRRSRNKKSRRNRSKK
jgi:hypothetical protein